jgi:uncharacterized membrane protein YfcA
MMATDVIGIIVTTVAGRKQIELFGGRIVLAIGLLGSGVSTLAFTFTNQATSQVLLILILLVTGGRSALRSCRCRPRRSAGWTMLNWLSTGGRLNHCAF